MNLLKRLFAVLFALAVVPASNAYISWFYWSSTPGGAVAPGTPYYIEASLEVTDYSGWWQQYGSITMYVDYNYHGMVDGYQSIGYGVNESWPAVFEAEAYSEDGGYDFISHEVVGIPVGQPTASVVVDGYSSGAVINRPPDGSPVTITVRYRASDPDGNLTGIRPQIWKPSGALDNNNGAFVPQSGSSGEVVRTVVLNENGNWRFWTDAQDTQLASTGDYVDSGSWSAGFRITVVQPPQSPNVNFTISATTAYIGQTLSLTSVATDVNGDLAFHTFWWDQGNGSQWTSPEFEYDGYEPNGEGWFNISNSYGSVANGSGQTITANWTAPRPGTYVFHSNAYDSRGVWGSGAVHTVVVQNRAPSVSYSILDSGHNPIGLDTNGRARLAIGSQFFVRISGTDPDARLANLYSRVNNSAGAAYSYQQIAVSGSSASHDFGPYYATSVGVWDVWGHAQDHDGGWADAGSPDIEVFQPNRPPTVSLTVNGVSATGGVTRSLTISNGSTLGFSTSASDPDGNLQRTRIWANYENQGWSEIRNTTATSDGFAYALSGIGVWQFHCRSLDNDGVESATAIVNVTSTNRAPINLSLNSPPATMLLGGSVALTSGAHDADGNLVGHMFWRRGPRGWDTFSEDWDDWQNYDENSAYWSSWNSPGQPSNPTNSTISATFTPPSPGYWQFHANAWDTHNAWSGGATSGSVFVAPQPSATIAVSRGQTSVGGGGSISVNLGQVITITSSASAAGWLSEHNIYGYVNGDPGNWFSPPNGGAGLPGADYNAQSNRSVTWQPTSPGVYTLYVEAFTGRSSGERVGGTSGYPGYFDGSASKRVTVTVIPHESPTVNFTVSTTTLYIGQTLNLQCQASDINSDMVFHTFWWDQGDGSRWTSPQFQYHEYEPNGEGWSNISNSDGSVSNGANNTVTANWSPVRPGVYQFHGNAQDARGGWGDGAEYTVTVPNRTPSVSYSILDSNHNPLAADGNGRVTVPVHGNYYVRVQGSDPDGRLSRLYLRMSTPAGASQNWVDVPAGGGNASHDFGPFNPNGTVGVWDVWVHAQDLDSTAWGGAPDFNGNNYGWATNGAIDVYSYSGPAPVATISVDGYSPNGTVIWYEGQPAPTVTVRYRATDADSNLQGIRPQVWTKWLEWIADGNGGYEQDYEYFDNNNGQFISQSGAVGEVVRTLTLDHDTDWYFWTDAIDTAQQFVNSGGHWTDGFRLRVESQPNPPPSNITISSIPASIKLGESVNLASSAVDVSGDMSGHMFWRRGPRDSNTFTQDSTGWQNYSVNPANWANWTNPGQATGSGQSSITATYTPPAPGYWQFYANAGDSVGGWGQAATTPALFVSPLPTAGISVTSNTGLAANGGGTLNVLLGSELTVTSTASAAGWLSEHAILRYSGTTSPSDVVGLAGNGVGLPANVAAVGSSRTATWTPSAAGTYTLYAEAFTGRTPTERTNGTSGFPGYFDGGADKRIVINVIVPDQPVMSVQYLDAGGNVLPVQNDGRVYSARESSVRIRLAASSPANGVARLYWRLSKPGSAQGEPPSTQWGWGGSSWAGDTAVSGNTTWTSEPIAFDVDGVWDLWYHAQTVQSMSWGAVAPWDGNSYGWTTIGGPDITIDGVPPSVPLNFMADAVTANSVALSWSPSSDDGVLAGYTLYKDGVPVAELGQSTSYTVTGLLSGRNYAFSVIARDLVGNSSAPNVLRVATLADSIVDADQDGLPDAWEILNGLNPNDPLDAQADTDGDGWTNMAEFNLALDPATANSGAASIGSSLPATWDTLKGKTRTSTVDGSPVTLLAGSTRGALSVDPSGAARYTIPITSPAGTAGLEPALSLNYSSNGANGILGVGWSLDGLSAITRGSSNKDLFPGADTVNDGADFDIHDRYFLDGQRLMAIAGANGAGNVYEGTEYRTYKDTFVKIIARGGGSRGPQWFEAWTKNGYRMEFGRTANSRLQGSDTSVGAWSISRIEDRMGNYLEVEYYKNPSNTTADQQSGSAIYPREIRYTGKVGGHAPYNKIEFKYEARPDSIRMSSPGSGLNLYHRLKQIDASTKDEDGIEKHVKSYLLDYERSDFTYRSRLTSVQELGTDGTAYPATEFTWKENTLAFTDTHQFNIAADNGLYFGDFNSDGRSDFVRSFFPGGWPHIQFHVNNGTGFYAASSEIQISADRYRSLKDLLVGDLNGDGTPDVLAVMVRLWYEGNLKREGDWVYYLQKSNYQEQVYTTTFNDSNGSVSVGGWSSYNEYENVVDRHDFYNPYIKQTGIAGMNSGRDCLPGYSLVDFSRSNRAEVLKRELVPKGNSVPESINNLPYWKIMRFNGNGWDTLYSTSPSGASLFPSDQMMIRTTTGDGASSFVGLSTYYTVAVLANYDGGNYTSSVQDLGQFVGSSTQRLEFGDFNGDGFTDTLKLNTAGSSQFLNGVAVTGATLADLAQQTLKVYDFNGDGRDDLLVQRDASCEIWTFEPDTASNWTLRKLADVAGGPLKGQKSDIVDFNGDGRADILVRVPIGNGNERVHILVDSGTGARGDVIESVTDGFGAISGVEYSQITNSDVYTKGALAAGKANVITPIQVVKKLSFDGGDAYNGTSFVGVYHTLTYKYEGLRGQDKRGILGFSAVESIDSRNSVKTRTEYSQDFPFTGTIVRTISSRDDLTLSETVSNNLQKRELNGAKSYFVYPKSVTTRVWGRHTDAETADYLSASQGDLVSHTATTQLFDDYGNITSTVIDAYNDEGEVERSTRTTTVFLPADSTDWVLGRVDTVTVEGAATGQTSKSRTVKYKYEHASNSLLLTKVIKDPSVDVELKKKQLATEYDYDAFGNVEKIKSTGYVDDSSEQVRYTLVRYDERGRFVEEVENQKGHITTFVVDQVKGVVYQQIDVNDQTTTYHYDGMLRPTRSEYPDTSISEAHYRWQSDAAADNYAGIVVETYSTFVDDGNTRYSSSPSLSFYDRLGRPTREASINADGNLVWQATWYNSAGQVWGSSVPYLDANAPTIYATINTYDGLGRPYKQRLPDETIAETLYGGLVVDSVVKGKYGSENLATRATRGTYSRQGRLLSVSTNPSELVPAADESERSALGHEYDVFGLIRKTVNPGGSEVVHTFDHRGAQTQLNDPDAGTWTYKVNAFGETYSQKDAKDQTTTIVYDVLGRVQSRAEAEGTTTWVYDDDDTLAPGPSKGFLASVSGPDGQGSTYSEDYEYDSYSRPLKTVRTIDGSEFEIATAYDNASRPQSVSYGGSGTQGYDFSAAYRYNKLGHLREIRDQATQKIYWTLQEVNAFGQPVAQFLGDGSEVWRTYGTKDGRLNNSWSTVGDLPLQRYEYAFDTLGSLRKRAEMDASAEVENKVESFDYDRLSRLKGTKLNGTSTGTMGYDALGNITTKPGVGSYNYDGRPHTPSVVNGTAYLYDDNGNLTHRGGTQEFWWMSFNQPKQITRNGNTATFRYGADRQRIAQTMGSKAIRYVSSGFEQVSIGSNVENRFAIFAAGSRVAQITKSAEGTSVRYLHGDHIGSVEAVTNERGILLERLSFDPWGKRRGSSHWAGAAAPRATNVARGFTDHEMLEELGLINMNGRVYDPSLGRFINPDPYVQEPDNPQNRNRYSYVLNNPMSYTDPSGFHYMITGPFSATIWTGSGGYGGGNIPTKAEVESGGSSGWGASNFTFSFGGWGGSSVFNGSSFHGGFYRPMRATIQLNQGTFHAQSWMASPNAGSEGGGVARQVVATNSGVLAEIGQSFKGFFYDGPKNLVRAINQAFYHPIDTLEGIGWQLAYEIDYITSDFSGYWSTFGNQLKSTLSNPNASGQLQFSLVSSAIPVSKIGQFSKISGGVEGAAASVCFVAGTEIATAEGARPIEDLRPGDLVMVRDGVTGENGFRSVITNFVRVTEELIVLSVGSEIIETTPEHPFWVSRGLDLDQRQSSTHILAEELLPHTCGNWVAAGELRTGDLLISADGEEIPVSRLVRRSISVIVYNLEIEGVHNYYVSDERILVHNKAQQYLPISGAHSKSVMWQGSEIRAVRDLGHLDEFFLRDMVETGKAGRTITGKTISLHHMGQKAAPDFFVEMPVRNNLISNLRQHPGGNAAGVGLTTAARSAFNQWRNNYWRARARQELINRGVDP